MKEDALLEIKQHAGIYGCVECGRCVAVCPMADMYVNFSIAMSPRGIIKKALAGEDLIHDRNIWYCTECNAGTDVCPQGVSCRDLIRGLREMATAGDAMAEAKYCACCRKPFIAVPVEEFVFARLHNEPSNVFKILELCPSCRRELYLVRNA